MLSCKSNQSKLPSLQLIKTMNELFLVLFKGPICQIYLQINLNIHGAPKAQKDTKQSIRAHAETQVLIHIPTLLLQTPAAPAGQRGNPSGS